ncbi:MAG: sugar phosphate isomerase/epimerase family protein [Planctomycetota bacterium]
MQRRLGACSWSFRPESPVELARELKACDIKFVQLALNPLVDGDWSPEETRRALDDAGLTIVSGMMETKGEDYTSLESIARSGGLRPEEHWLENLDRAKKTAVHAHKLDLKLVTFHAGFIPHDPKSPLRRTMIERIQTIVDLFAKYDVAVGLETGQETASTLVGVLAELNRATVGINFDPANMILYGMGDPLVALEKLAPRVRQIHIKDALYTDESGQWGQEVCAGTGAVVWARFFNLLRDRKLMCDLIIERESGDQRSLDIKSARSLVAAEVTRIEN